MTPEIFGVSVRGASHARADKECQDSMLYGKIELVPPKKLFSTFRLKKDEPKFAYAMAAADGHGSASCPYSKDGSSIAVETFVLIMEDYCRAYAGDMDELSAFLDREGELKLAKVISMEWKKRVLARHMESGRGSADAENEADIIMQYGTTLLGFLYSENFVFAFQLGDGDIVFLNDAVFEPIISPEHILGVETHSLGKSESWRNAITAIKTRPQETAGRSLYMLSTDGFSNSFADDGEYEKSCRDYFKTILEHGAEAVSQNLSDWLTETSEKGCGDDITVLFLFEPARINPL